MSTADKIINKANMAARIVAQKNVGQAAITSVREMLRSRVPVGIGEYLDNPLADVVIAFVIVGLQEQYANNPRFGYIANGALMAGMDTVVDGLGIQEMITELMKQLSGQIPEDFKEIVEK